jgi:hypothetical protein
MMLCNAHDQLPEQVRNPAKSQASRVANREFMHARDCVVRLANRVDDWRFRERLLQMAREWKAEAMDEGNRSLAVT